MAARDFEFIAYTVTVCIVQANAVTIVASFRICARTVVDGRCSVVVARRLVHTAWVDTGVVFIDCIFVVVRGLWIGATTRIANTSSRLTVGIECSNTIVSERLEDFVGAHPVREDLRVQRSSDVTGRRQLHDQDALVFCISHAVWRAVGNVPGSTVPVIHDDVLTAHI